MYLGRIGVLLLDMKRTLVTLIAVGIALLGAPASSAAPSPAIKPAPHVYDVCKEAAKKLGPDVPCETSASAVRLICWTSKPYFATHYYFRLYTNGAWQPWRMYYTTLKPVPAKVC